MAEDTTRRLLKVFGIAVTECEDALGELEAALRASGPGAVPARPLEAFAQAASELEDRWAELGRLVQGLEGRARHALVAALRVRGAA
jgi:hypothetical protein